LERLILETDCPWCDIRQTHAGYSHIQSAFPSKKEKQYSRDIGKEFCVKNRTEPCHVAQVAEVVAGIKSLSVEEVVNVCCKNVHDLFGSLEKS
jgi:TatD DNase family protein